MKSEFKIMRIGGIDIKVGWSLLIIGVFISFSLMNGYFPLILPGWNGLAYFMAALFSFIGLYASVLLHELAHAYVAQKQGLEVKSIVLTLFGGASNLNQESRSPRAEFWLAIVGPLTNFGLAMVLFGSTALLIPSMPLVGAIIFYLAGANLILGAVNLIPAYPLDGGRVLKALVWGWTKNEATATNWVGKVGRGFGWGFISLGLFVVMSGDPFEGMWLMVMGWFLTSAARLSSTQPIASYTLQGVKVGQVMWHDDRLLTAQTPLSLAAQSFVGMEPGRVLPVVDQGYLLGTLSLEQVRKTKATEREQMQVEKVMTRRGSLLALHPEDDLEASMKTLTLATKPFPYAAVIGAGGQFAGLFYLSDIPRFLEMQQLLQPLENSAEQPTTKLLAAATSSTKNHTQSNNTPDRDNSNQPQPPKLDDKVA